MNPNDELRLKNDAFKWAEYELSHEPIYWRDREQHGNGLIKLIAAFVLKHGQVKS